MKKEIDIINQDIEAMVNNYLMSTELWEQFSIDSFDIDFSRWKSIKFFGGRLIGCEIEKVPSRKGGLYVFYIQNPILPRFGKYIMYIGMATLTSKESLRRRLRSHFNDYKADNEQDRITRMFEKWPEYVYVAFLPLEDNQTIIQLEQLLIDTITPPCNKRYYSPKIRRRMAAFQY